MHQPNIPAKMELKYCERCGGLWLRPVGDPAPYCAACDREMAQLPAPSRSSREQAEPGTGGPSPAPAPEIVRVV